METTDLMRLVRSNIASLEPYSTARDEYKGNLGILLDANENPFGGGLNRYPSTTLRDSLVAKLAEIKGVLPGQLFLGNGSDECIDLCYRVFCRPGKDNAVMITPSYGMYKVCADINDVEARQVKLGKDFSLPVEDLLAASDNNSRLLFICSPNNPTANSFPESQIRTLLDEFPGIVVLDEAYADFSARGSLKKLLEEYPRLIILQTLSKAWGMAGLRLGMALADSAVVRLFNRVRYPYNIGTDTLQLALELLPKSYVESKVSIIVKERERVRAALAEIPTIREVLPSDANFFLIRTDCPRCLYNFLLSRGIIVRDRSNTPLCGPALRLTIGNPGENDKLIKAITEYDSIQSTIH
jgi:histidinol-phosphate aminotransferase